MKKYESAIGKILAFAAACVLCLWAAALAENPVSDPWPVIQAHAGASLLAPENTLAAFRAAKAVGADGIETDVRMTKDRRLVLSHDDEIDRTSDGHGRISEMTLEALKSYDYGSWFGAEFAGEQILTLEECLRAAEELDFRMINLELKPAMGLDDEYVRLVADTIRRSGVADRIVVSSFDSRLLKGLKEHAPEIPVALLTIPNLMAISFLRLEEYLPQDKALSDYTPEDVQALPEFLALILRGFGAKGETAAEIYLGLVEGIAAVVPAGAAWGDMERLIQEQRDLAAYVDGLGFQIDWLNCHHSTLSGELMEAMAARGIKVNVWTPDTAEDLKRVLALHPDGVVTDELETALMIAAQNP